MKKFLTIVLMYALCTPALAINENEPKWEEFAPTKYVNPKDKSDSGFEVEMAIGGLLTSTIVLAPIGAPLMIHAENRRKHAYWSERKRAFNNAVNTCKLLQNTNEINACFINVRNDEAMKRQK